MPVVARRLGRRTRGSSGDYARSQPLAGYHRHRLPVGALLGADGAVMVQCPAHRIRISLVAGVTDMRKGFDGLAGSTVHANDTRMLVLSPRLVQTKTVRL